MIPIYICDDDTIILENILSIIQKEVLIENLDMGPIFSTTSPEKILKKRSNGTAPGIYFLDVDFSERDIDGFHLASEIRKLDPRGYIIFITSHSERSFETFHYKLEAMDYIVKGEKEDLTLHIRSCLKSIEKRVLSENDGMKKFYSLKIFDNLLYIPIDEILYFEAEGSSHRIYLYTEKETFNFFGSLKSIEKELGEGFFRSHRSFLINQKKIYSVHLKTNLIELTNGASCPLSRSAKKFFSL